MTAHAQYEGDDSAPRVWIAVDVNNGIASLIPTVAWPEDADLTYRFTVEKSGRSGTSSSSQGGAKSVAANANVHLVRSAMNIPDGTTLTATLDVTGPDGQVLSDEVVLDGT